MNNSNGHFGYYGLYDWWINNFSEKEKETFETLYRPMGGSFNDLVSGNNSFEGKSPVWFLTMLAAFARNKLYAYMALKFLDKAESLVDSGSHIDKHFLYHRLIEGHYILRNDANHYDKAKYYCKLMIESSKQAKQEWNRKFGQDKIGNHGYYQYAIILEKEGNFQEAKEICEQAIAENWSGDWENRIIRLNKKLSKTKS